jgi:hypothetical protein
VAVNFETITADDDLFFNCERMHCRLLKSVCVSRQTERGRMWGRKLNPFDSCKNCEQGKRIAAEFDENTENLSIEIDTGTDIGGYMGQGVNIKKTAENETPKNNEKLPTRGPETKTCAQCGVEFERRGEIESVWQRKKYCSKLCSKEAEKQRARETYKKRQAAQKATQQASLKSKEKPVNSAAPAEIDVLVQACRIHDGKLADNAVFREYLKLAYDLGKAAA